MYVNESKIHKYQAGGMFPVYQPLPVQAPQAPAPMAQTTEGATAQAAAPALDKSIVTKLLGAGLTNDVMAFSDQMNKAYEAYAGMSEMERGTHKGQELRQIMKGDIGQINMLMRNQQEFDSSREKVKSQDAFGEFATTARGLVVKDITTGTLSEISHSDYANDLHSGKRKYQALTNAELINEREYNPLLVNDKNSINALNSSMGMEAIKKEITSVLANLGSTSKSESRSFYADTADGPQIRKAAQELAGMAREGVYKIEQMASSESNEKQLKAAASAMWQNLSNSAKSVLKARAVASGAKSGSIEETAMGYALSLLNPSAKSSMETKSAADYDTTLNKPAKGSEDELTSDIGYWQASEGSMGNPQIIQVDLGDGDQLTALGAVAGPIQSNGKPVGQSSIRNIPELKSIANINNMYMGSNKIDPNYADAIVYGGDDMIRVHVPAMKDGNGGMKPNFDIMPKYNKVMKEIQSIPNAMARQKVIEAAGFQMGQDGLPEVEKAEFVMFNGMVNDGALGTSNYDKRLLKKVDGNLEKQYERSYRYNGESPDKDGTDLKPTEYESFLPRFLSAPDVLQGNIFIQVKPGSAVSARLADGAKVLTTKPTNSIPGLNQNNFNRKPAETAGVISQFQL